MWTGPDTRQTRLAFKMGDDKKVDEELKRISDLQNLMQRRIDKLEEENRKLRDQINQLENQSRRENLVFHGITESSDSDAETWRDCEEKVQKVIKEKLIIDPIGTEGGVEIERAHRLPKPRMQRRDGRAESLQEVPRPIIVKFSKFKQREKVKDAAFKNLKPGSVIRVKEDFSQRVRFIRWKLGEIMVELKTANKNAKLKFDKLVVDGQSYRYDEETGMVKRISDLRLFLYDETNEGLIPAEDNARVETAGDDTGPEAERI